MKIAIASDHGGFELKEDMIKHLKQKGYKVIDLGTDSCESVDYPEYGRRCSEMVVNGQADKGIVCCGTGIGISMAANKVKGARCSLCTSRIMAEMTRKHNDANVLALGGRITPFDEAKAITDIWLETEFEGGRHQRRVDELDAMG